MKLARATAPIRFAIPRPVLKELRSVELHSPLSYARDAGNGHVGPSPYRRPESLRLPRA